MIDAFDVPAGSTPFRSLSGWLPLILAAAALALLGGFWLTGPHPPNMVLDHGVYRHDESTTARIWQLLMLAQLLAIGVFLIRWVPRAPKPTLAMFALQLCGLAAAALPVWLLEHA